MEAAQAEDMRQAQNLPLPFTLPQEQLLLKIPFLSL